MAYNWKGWVPASVRWSGEAPEVEWIATGGHRFTDPFFEDTIHRIECAAGGGGRAPRRPSGMALVEEWARESPGLVPAGFVFHLSRCGSTLVSQMLAAVERNRVLSEPPALDDVLRLQVRGQVVDEARLTAYLCGVMSALGQAEGERERHLFVKWDCWHIHQMAAIRRAFPQTPWVFLYRDPVEVLESQMRKPGMWTVPGALEEALTGGADWRNGREEYCARMLGAICEAAIRERATLVNYSELPLAVGRLAHFFGVEYTAAEWEAMLAAAGFDAKSPCFAFTADGEEKRRRASGAVVEAAARWIGAAYQELEVLRRGGRGLPE